MASARRANDCHLRERAGTDPVDERRRCRGRWLEGENFQMAAPAGSGTIVGGLVGAAISCDCRGRRRRVYKCQHTGTSLRLTQRPPRDAVTKITKLRGENTYVCCE